MAAQRWRARGGDGLGPVFNDTSCVACHNQGGAGGGGPASKNVDVISVFSNGVQEMAVPGGGPSTLPEAMFRAMFGGFGSGGTQMAVQATGTAVNSVAARATDSKAIAKRQIEELMKIHPGFVNVRSVVLHKSGTDPAYDAWRMQMKGQGQFQVSFVPSPNAAADFNVVRADAAPVSTIAISETAIAEGTQNVVVLDKESSRSAAPADAAVTAKQAAEEAARNQMAQQIIQQHRSTIQQFRSATQGSQANVGNFTFLGSQRNPTALFGAGVIDAIPDEAIKANAGKKHKDFPEVQGRVAKLKDGRIGRFGWKNQTATLYDFAMTACAVELGLEVPDQPQAGVPQKPDYKAPGTDMNKEECNALVDYLKNLPAQACHALQQAGRRLPCRR